MTSLLKQAPQKLRDQYSPEQGFDKTKFLGPAAALFISANIANLANLAFNMTFARLMGPAAFADLTLLLTIKLGILSFLGAMQFAFSEITAKEKNPTLSAEKARGLSWLSLKISVPVMFAIIASANFLAQILNFSSPFALCVLALAVPLFLPMILYRGLTQGRIDVPKIIASIQAEWIIRLFGSLILWQMGFGLGGIALAMALSILAGYICSTDGLSLGAKTPKTAPHQRYKWQDMHGLIITALPYLILQFAQILVLDSDIFIAKTLLSAESAGMVAGLLLIQRIFFFAFLSASMVLQPIIAARGQSMKTDNVLTPHKTPNELLILLAAIALITTAAIAIIIPNAELMISLMLGDAYLPLAPILWISALTGAIFMASHLCAIFQIASGRNFAAKIILAFGLLQAALLTGVLNLFPQIALYSYFSLKLGIQILCAAYLLASIVKDNRMKAR